MCVNILHYLIIFAVDEGQFEAVLSGVHHHGSSLGVSVQAVDCGPPHHCDVYGEIQCPYDPIVTEERGGEGVYKHTIHNICI